MSDQTAQEPTMEEILASIRRIISEDDAPESEDSKPGDPPEGEVAELEAPVMEAEPEPEPEPEPVMEVAAEEDDVLELTERVETVGDLDVYSPTTAPAAEPEASTLEGEGIVGPVAASAAASAFGQLSASILMGNADLTLEQLVREMLRPMLKDWLDANLPRIVQATVDAEVERIARGRVR